LFICDEKTLHSSLERAGFTKIILCDLNESYDEAMNNFLSTTQHLTFDFNTLYNNKINKTFFQYSEWEVLIERTTIIGIILAMKYRVSFNNDWIKIGPGWWTTDNSMEGCKQPSSENEFLALLKNIKASSILVLDDCILLYSGQFYSTNIFYTKIGELISISDDLRCLTSKNYKLDSGAIGNYTFAKGFYFNQTPFLGISKVSQGCLCKLTDHSSVHERYLNLIRPSKASCTPERFSSLMEEKLSFVDGKQVVVTLSGGLDSSYVSAFIKKHFECDLKGVHIYCSEGEPTNTELESAKFVAQKIGIPLTAIDFTWQRFHDTFVHFCKLSPLPFPNSGYRYYLLNRYCSEKLSPDYFISGDASDTLFELSPDFYLFNKMNLFDKWAPVKYYEKLDSYIDRLRPNLRVAESFRWRLNKYLDFRLRLFHWKGTGVDYFNSWSESFFSSGESARLSELIEARGMYDLDNRLFLLNTYFSYLELPIFIPLIRQLFGAEYYTPFLDPDIIGLALNLSNRQTKSKKFLKEIALSYLPTEIVTRKKMGLIIPLQSWLLGPMRPIAMELLLGKKGLICRGLVDEDVLTGLVKNFFDGSGQFGWCEIMSLFTLEVWLRINFDNSYEPTDIENVSLSELISL